MYKLSEKDVCIKRTDVNTLGNNKVKFKLITILWDIFWGKMKVNIEQLPIMLQCSSAINSVFNI